MPSALVGAISCAGCGHPIAGSVAICGDCGAPLAPAAPGSALAPVPTLTSGLVPARSIARLVATAIDVVLPVTLGVVGVALVSRGDISAGIVASLAALALLVLQRVWFHRSGRSLGRFALGLRTVDDLIAEPPRVLDRVGALFRGRRPARTVTVSIRHGRDPLHPAAPAIEALAAAATPAETTGTAGRTRRRAAESTASVTLELDTGERHELHGSALVGRAPERKDGDEHLLLAWPDLGRTLSKTHALVEWSGSVLWVTDLESTNGTVIVSPTEDRQLLTPGVRSAASLGWTIEFADRQMTILPGSTGRSAG